MTTQTHMDPPKATDESSRPPEPRPDVGFWLLMVLSLAFVGGLAFLQYLRVDEARRGRTAGAPVRLGALAPDPLPVIAEVPPFNLTDRTGKRVTRDDLRGRVWVANFVFTFCYGPCPVMSIRMKALQDLLKTQKYDDVVCVSFTVDPDRDTPEVLDEYAQALGAELGRWLFLTGPKKPLRELVLDGFKLAVQDPEQGEDQVIHSTRMVLVDRLGRIRGYYSTMTEEEEIDPQTADREGGMPVEVKARLMADIARLRAEASR